ncbi:MAG: hypothetical protein ACHQ50_02355 [Fimbriimonadales bacterium]
MSLSAYLRAASLAVAALLSYAIAPAQGWPQRWDTSSTYDDEAVACAVDHQGNVFVAGWSKEFRSPYKDMVVIKYDSAGNQLWVNNYHGRDSGGTAYSGDTVGTSVACDWNGDVYVAGVSYGGSTRKNDFFVMKYDPNGLTIWPTSGSRGSGAGAYDFDHGALRMADSGDDGIVPTALGGGVVCAMSMEDVAGSQPTFAITGPSTAGGGYAHFRTVVFEYDATDGIRIKSGWPVDTPKLDDRPDGDYGDCVPYALAIYSGDHSVYATGTIRAHLGSNAFAIVRYDPTGTNYTSGVIPGQRWLDTWGTNGNEYAAVGKSIALDPYSSSSNPDCYVTGIHQSLAIGDTTDKIKYATERVDGGGAGAIWRKYYSNASNTGYCDDEAASISLSFEIESGSEVTYAYVTGKSRNTDGTKDVETLRYNSGGTQVASARYNNSGYDSFGLQVVAAGNGNAYVVGNSNDENLLIAYDKTFSTRFTPVLYQYQSGSRRGPGRGHGRGRLGSVHGCGIRIRRGQGLPDDQPLRDGRFDTLSGRVHGRRGRDSDRQSVRPQL